MSSQAGKLAYVKVNNNPASGSNFCLFGLVQSNGATEHIFLWLSTASDQPTAVDWVLRNAQIALLRDAIVHKLTVVVFTDDITLQVTSIQLGAMASGEPVV
jgi:hypothetical protein